MANESAVILLDRVKKGFTPDYCLHGKTTCVRCGEWVHLGHDTVKVVESGQAKALCMDCVEQMIELGLWPKDARPERRVNDHKRAAGPHEDFVPPDDWIAGNCANPRCLHTVWYPPLEDAAMPVLRTCSTKCADQVMRDRDRE